ELTGARVEIGYASASLHRHIHRAVLAERFVYHAVRSSECRVHVAMRRGVLIENVATNFVKERRSIRVERIFDRHHRLEGLVFHLDDITRIFGHVAALSHDERHRVAHQAHAIGGQRMERRVTHPRLVFDAHRTDEPLHVLANEDRHHARHGARRADVDAHDARVRVRAAQKCRVEHAWQTDVVDVVAVASEDALILYTLDAGTNKPHASFTL